MVERGAQPEDPILPPPSDLKLLVSRPAPVIAHPAWREARDKVLALVQGQGHLIAILGPVGSGKTTLLRDLAQRLEHLKPVTYFSEFSDNSCAFPPDSIVLVDEAERLSSTSFDMLARREGITLIIAALPSFYVRFMGFREGIVVALSLLKDDEAAAFLAEWMAGFGLPMNSLTPEAWERLIAHCRGVPRLLASLLKLALFVGADESAPRVLLEHVELAIAVQGGSAETRLAEVAGRPHQGNDHDSPGDAPAEAPGEPNVPPSDPAPIVPVPLVDEASSPTLLHHSPADEPAHGERKVAYRSRILGWVTAGVVFLAAVGFVLLWSHHWHFHSPLSDRTLLAQDTARQDAPGTASAFGAAEERSRPGASIPSSHVESQAPAASSQGASATASADARQAEANQVAATAPVPGLQSSAGPVTAPASTPPNQVDQTSSASTSPAAAAPAQHPSSSDDISTANGAVPANAFPAAASVKLPSGASIRIVVTYAWGDNVASQRSLELSRTLRADGFNVGDPFPVARRSAKRGIRFYFVQDEGVAEEITARLGDGYGAATLARISARDGLPRPGTIEIGVGHD